VLDEVAERLPESRHARQPASARAIANMGFSELRRQLDYKVAWALAA
jgi:transposase